MASFFSLFEKTDRIIGGFLDSAMLGFKNKYVLGTTELEYIFLLC